MPRTKRGTIQSVDRAGRILKALAAGPRRLGVLPRGPAPGVAAAVAEAARAVSRELGSRRWPGAPLG